MKADYRTLLPEDFSNDSRVWIYQASRLLSLQEALRTEELLQEFTSQWKTHGTPVKGYGNLFFGQFIVLMADESATGVSGCSTDSSVRLIKQLEHEMKVSFFDRQLLAFYIREKIELIPLSQFDYAIRQQLLTPETLYFNNTVLTKKELETSWILPIRETWLARRLNTVQTN
ncbi:MAG TPA: hypothetical protein VMI35_14600 [Puia sp.]|nr:hypothetical protein [Puia sp.]